MAGPGAISATTLLSDEFASVEQPVILIGVIFAVIATAWLVFLLS